MTDYPSQNHSSVHLDNALLTRMAAAKESVWFRIGVLQSTMNDRDRALDAFERVLAVNPSNVRAMTQAGAVLAKKECYPQAVAYLQRAIQADSTCGEAWAVLAHCYVMTDDLQKAYQAYQSALTHLPNPRDPNLWYGIGLLYDRYGSLEHALEAFLLVLSIAPDFERADEVCFCIGIIYKEQQNFDEALRYFNKVVVAANPPPPLTRADGWYQIGHVSELKRDIPTALEMYKQALAENPKHPKTLQNYGWLEHQHNNKSAEAIRLLKMSAELDSSDGQTWYLLGRVYMALREFRQAYDAYQQAVYRDSRNATFWCSIGVLYYQMNQFRDAMDAYSRAIILNPQVSEVWYDLGTLYESCGQNDDAIDAYRRAAKLAPDNTQITDRLTVLENSANPSGQQGQQQQQQQQQQQHHRPHNVSQPAMSGPPPISLSHPSQMHPDMPQRSLGHEMPHGVSSTFSQPLHLMSESRRPSQPQQSSSLQFNPPALVTSQTQSLSQSRQLGLGSLAGPSASAPMEMAPIPSMQAPNALAESHPATSNSSFPPNDRQPLRAGPLPPVSTSNSVNGPSVNHLVSQPRPQGSSTFLPQITHSAPEPVDVMPLRSSPAESQMQSSNHPTFHHSDGIRAQNNISSKERTPGGHPGNSVGPHSPSKPSQSMHSPQKSQLRNDQQDGHGHSQPSSYEQGVNGRSQNQQQQGGQQSVPSPSRHSMHAIASQPDTSLTQIPPLQPISGLPPVQPQSNDDGEKSDRHRGGLNTSGDERERSTSALDTGNAASQFGQGDNVRRNDYDGQDHRDDGRLPKLSRSDGGNDGSGNATDVDSNNRASFSAPMQTSSIGQSRDRISHIRESIAEDGNPAPNNSRQIVLHDVSHSETHDESRRHAPQRHDNSQHNDRESNAQNGRDQLQQNGVSDGKSDRLPSMNSLPSMDMGTNRRVQDDGDIRGSIPQVSPPSLTLPASGALPSMTVSENGKPNSSPSHGASSPGTGSAMGTAGASLPPLSSGRNTGSLSRMNQDSKDLTNPGGISSGLGGLGTSSLTKFGRGPQTPSTNSVVPASLPSPLSRKPTTGPTLVHSGRSPRLSKPTPGGAYKPIPMSVPGGNYGPMEQVPSPGSLPVLPPMNSRPGNYNDDDKGNEKRMSESDRDGEHHPVDNRKFVGDDKSGKDGGESNGHGRVSDDVLDNKPVFGVLRPSNSGEKELDHADSDEKVKSSDASPSRGGHGENVLPGKRENLTKEDMGRTPKRPRLHDVNDKDLGAEMYGYDGNDDGEKGKDLPQRKDDDNGKSNVSGLSKNDHKGERRTGNGPDDGKKHLRRDSGGRGSDGEMSKNTLNSQVIDLPRLSNQAMPKLGGPPLSGNQPLPSFRSERKNLSASRGSGGAGTVGKALNGDSSTRGSLPFPLRSAPVSSIAPLKNLGGGSTGGRGGGEHGDYESSPRVGDGTGPKRVGEDKTDGSMTRGSGRDRE